MMFFVLWALCTGAMLATNSLWAGLFVVAANLAGFAEGLSKR